MSYKNVMNFTLTYQFSIFSANAANRPGSTMTTDTSRKTRQNIIVARRLITVALTDFLCWFPVGVVGLLAAQG